LLRFRIAFFLTNSLRLFASACFDASLFLIRAASCRAISWFILSALAFACASAAAHFIFSSIT
jgi:hypothetical protein